MAYIIETTPDGNVRRVATLGEARDTARRIISDQMPGDPRRHRLRTDAQRVTAGGGTIGPLTDGTIITIRPKRMRTRPGGRAVWDNSFD